MPAKILSSNSSWTKKGCGEGGGGIILGSRQGQKKVGWKGAAGDWKAGVQLFLPARFSHRWISSSFRLQLARRHSPTDAPGFSHLPYPIVDYRFLTPGLVSMDTMPRSSSRPRPSSRPTTPLRPGSRSSFRDAHGYGGGGITGAGYTTPAINALEPQFAELADSMADLEANFMHLQLMHESLSRFSESFASFLYGLNMNAFCVDFPEV